jgi:hypothetical protein
MNRRMRLHRLCLALLALAAFAAAPAGARQQVFWTLSTGGSPPPTATPIPYGVNIDYLYYPYSRYYPCRNSRLPCRNLVSPRPLPGPTRIPLPVAPSRVTAPAPAPTM